MLIFLWLLGALGDAYGAKLNTRNAFGWFVLSLAITPLGGSILLILANRYRVRLANLL